METMTRNQPPSPAAIARIPESLQRAASLVVKTFDGVILGVTSRKPIPPPPQVSEEVRWLTRFIESGAADSMEPFELWPGISVADPGQFCRQLLSDFENPDGGRCRAGVAQEDFWNLRDHLSRERGGEALGSLGLDSNWREDSTRPDHALDLT